jgi:hypothetical protein
LSKDSELPVSGQSESACLFHGCRLSIEPLATPGESSWRVTSADVNRLLTAGVTVALEPATTRSGDEMAFLRDPWGFRVQLVKRSRPLLPVPRPVAQRSLRRGNYPTHC